MKECIIRNIRPDEIQFLSDFLYEAIFQVDETNLLPKNIINQPNLKIYIEDFGRYDDVCIIADISNQVVGAVWSRILAGEIKGYGNIDDNTPELAISIIKPYRNKGIGTLLLQSILKLLKTKGYKQVSLSVQKDNYAFKLYQKVGFKLFKELADDYLMIYRF